MEFFEYKDNQLTCENVKIEDIAKEVGTPAYIYSKKAFVSCFNELKNAFKELNPIICFSIKSNSNLSILKTLKAEGSGFDVVSGGELYRALKIGADPQKIVFAGVGKTSDELKYAIENNILMFNAESWSEIGNINRVAGELNKNAQIALRINPDVDAKTHAKTTTGTKENKFGIDLKTAGTIISRASDYPNVSISGIQVHLGSPIYSTEPYEKGLEKINVFIPECRKNGVDIKYLNIGGGYCISYTGEKVIRPDTYAAKTLDLIKKTGCQLLMEPGRFISGNSGILVTKVVYRKKNDIGGKKFVICDAAMNDLIRPALYDSLHRIWPLSPKVAMPEIGETSDRDNKTPVTDPGKDLEVVDIVGPVCESSDAFAINRVLPNVNEGEYLSIFSSGAYGFTMSSSYNSRPRPCEVLIDGSKFDIVRKRETYEDLVAAEVII